MNRHLSLCHEGKEEIRTCKSRIKYLDTFRDAEFFQFCDDCRTKPVICIERVSYPDNHLFGVPVKHEL